MLNFIKKKNKIKKIDTIYLNTQAYIKRLSFFYYILNKKNITLLTSDNTKITTFSQNKITLPNNIDKFNNIKDNFNYLLYIFTYFAYINKLNIKIDNDYNTILTTLITIKTIKEQIKKENIKLDSIEKKIFNYIETINKKHTNILTKIILNKLIYNKNRLNIILNNEEKQLIYKIENINNLTQKNFNKTLNAIHTVLNNLYKGYKDSHIQIPWGLMINDTTTINTPYTALKKNIKHAIKKIKQLNLLTKNKKLNEKKEAINNLSNIFDYKKTIDKYDKQNKKNTNTSEKNVIDKLNTSNLENTTRYKKNSKYLIRNDISQNKIYDNPDIYHKYDYKEWDCHINKYKKNWCKVFEKTIDKTLSKQEKTEYKIFIRSYKKEIQLIRKKIHLLLNKKEIIKSKDGHSINLDAIIDNYVCIKNSTHAIKLYQYKSKKQRDLYFLLLFDSSMSTDTYINTKKTIEIIKELTLFISLGFENLIKYEIATFHSNTRHDCRYYKLKNSNEKISKKAHIVLNTNTTGYTRIGPSLRHSINIIKKRKEKNKIIILITDGTPTDYDEYEGEYGSKDIKATIKEANKFNIEIKTIVTNKEDKLYLRNMFGLNNYITTNKISPQKLINIFKNII